MDKIFGMNNFQNEIVWHYKGRGMQRHKFQRKHDILFYYSKSKLYHFNTQDILVPLDPKHIGRYNRTDENGKSYALIKGHSGHYSKIYRKDGIVPDDVWDIPFIHGNEAIGYPTQKPEALLKRIIKASSNKGDIVLDPFCGCGTTIAVAHQLERQWVGIDVSPTACEMMATRLNKLGVIANVEDMPETAEHLRDLAPFEFQNWVIRQITGSNSNKKSGDMGIDGYDFTGKPVQVKQSDNVGRNVVDNFETAIRRANYTEGSIYSFSFVKVEKEEVARASLNDNLNIKLISIDTLLNGVKRKATEQQGTMLKSKTLT